jgi:hypothetical protein
LPLGLRPAPLRLPPRVRIGSSSCRPAAAARFRPRGRRVRFRVFRAVFVICSCSPPRHLFDRALIMIAGGCQVSTLFQACGSRPDTYLTGWTKEMPDTYPKLPEEMPDTLANTDDDGLHAMERDRCDEGTSEVHPRMGATPPEEVEDPVVAARKAHPRWGPRKLRSWLLERKPLWLRMTSVAQHMSLVAHEFGCAAHVFGCTCLRLRSTAQRISAALSSVTQLHAQWAHRR